MPKKPAPTYQSLKAELDDLMAELQRDDLDVDLALQHYRRGLELVQQLEDYLKTAQNQVKELQAKPPKPAPQ
jgi:exodeoxyribonuclease VII small subunit